MPLVYLASKASLAILASLEKQLLDHLVEMDCQDVMASLDALETVVTLATQV